MRRSSGWRFLLSWGENHGQPQPQAAQAVHQLTSAEFDTMFPHEDGCKAYLQARRWREGVRCPRCGNPGVYDLTSRKWHWQCPKCAIHINTIEGFWSIFKRGVMGTFHKMSKKYMGFYVAEIRYNNRENGNTFGTAIKEC